MAKQSTNRPVIGDLLKSLPKTETPVQEVRPVPTPTSESAPKPKPEQVRINGFWVNADLGERFRVRGAKENKKPRQILIEALEAFLATE